MRKKRRATVPFSPVERPAIQMNVSCRVELDELAKLKPDQVTAFLRGVGKVIAASK